MLSFPFLSLPFPFTFSTNPSSLPNKLYLEKKLRNKQEGFRKNSKIRRRRRSKIENC